MIKRLNPFGQAVYDTRYKAKLDAAAKRLIASKPIIAYILKHCVAEVEGYSQKEIELMIDQVHTAGVPLATGSSNDMITGEPQESTITGEGRLTFDILTALTLPDGRVITIDLELQGKSDEVSVNEVRGMYYNARQLSMQLGRNNANYLYRHPQKVYSIWILLNASQKDANTISEIYPKMRDLGGHYEGHPKIDIQSEILIRVAKDGEIEKAKNPLLPVTGMLGTLFSESLPPEMKIRILEEEYGIICTEEMKEEVEDMFSYADAIAEKAEEKARNKMLSYADAVAKKAEEKTRKEMLSYADAVAKEAEEKTRNEMEAANKETLKQHRKEIAKRMLRDGKLNDKDIADYIGVSADELKRLKNEL